MTGHMRDFLKKLLKTEKLAGRAGITAELWKSCGESRAKICSAVSSGLWCWGCCWLTIQNQLLGLIPWNSLVPPQTLNRAQSLHYKTFFCLPKWDKSVALANRNTSHVLIKKCCSVLSAQGVSSVPAYLELVGSQLRVSRGCFLSTSAVLADFSKVYWLFICHS